MKILLVEDDINLSLGVEYALTNEGYNVLTAKKLAEAREILSKENIELIILDIQLPDGSGYELCKEIREKSDVPIIYLTALDDEVNVVMGLDMGGDDYITKPFRVKELLSRVRAVIRRKNNKSRLKTKHLISGLLELIISESKVMYNQKEILLTPIEYKLLLTFMSNSNQVLTRQILLSKIWDVNEDYIDDNTLSVHIKRLREKIDIDNNKHIETVRGQGYKWDKDVISQ